LTENTQVKIELRRVKSFTQAPYHAYEERRSVCRLLIHQIRMDTDGGTEKAAQPMTNPKQK
jgi:hypothetical protein